MRIALALCILGCPTATSAESVIAQRNIPAHSIIVAEDLATVDAEIDGAVSSVSMAIGQEVRTTVYAGRPLLISTLAAPALVDRNQIVVLVFQNANLSIMAEGRALQRGAEGDSVRALNLASKTTVSGRIGPDGKLYVGDRN